ncbi:hypothetical protein, partial [Neisseria gonorrhoeae]|uniref:hypothetical protein n=2 Tax=Pseudomonadota TaxID=1224 RepID=UPI001C99D698
GAAVFSSGLLSSRGKKPRTGSHRLARRNVLIETKYGSENRIPALREPTAKTAEQLSLIAGVQPHWIYSIIIE